MATAAKTTPKKNGSAAPPPKLKAMSGTVTMAPGTGSERVTTRLIVLYGAPKCRKTTSASKLEGAKWIVSDPNCFGAETQFITTDGVRCFTNFKDGDKVVVLTHTGQWKQATVHNYGKKPLMAVVFGRGRNTQTVRATANHRWLLEGGRQRHTVELALHDKLLKPPHIIRDWSYEDSADPVRRWWMQGFIFGDGATQFAHGKEIGSRVRLCGEKRRFAGRFEELGYTPTFPESSAGEPCFYFPEVFKHLPSIDIGVVNMTAFVRGMLDADGTKNDHGDEVNPFQGIQVTGKEAVEFVRCTFPMVGAYIVKETDVSEQVTNFGLRSDLTVYFSLVLGFSNSPVAPYNVRGIAPLDGEEDVWCLDVEDDHSFILPSGVVTGNCIPTLDAMGRLPPPEDIYEVDSLVATRELLGKMIEAAKAGGLGTDVVVLDSATAVNDWHQQDVAAATQQRFMGDNAKNNGWTQFNAEFGAFIDDLGALSKLVTVVVICHAKEKPDLSKGEWSGLNLPPQMALKLGRTANWVLYQSIRSVPAVDKTEKDSDEYVTYKKMPDGTYRGIEVVIYTQPIGLWTTSCNSRMVNGEPTLSPEEPADLDAILKKEGLR